MTNLHRAIEEFGQLAQGDRIMRLANTNVAFTRCRACEHHHMSVWLHRTEVLRTFCDDGLSAFRTSCRQYVELAHGGWQTVTTKRRMNEVLTALGIHSGTDPEGRLCGVYQQDFEWYTDGQRWRTGAMRARVVDADAAGSQVSPITAPAALMWLPVTPAGHSL
jgi:hypothetical protein